MNALMTLANVKLHYNNLVALRIELMKRCRFVSSVAFWRPSFR